MRAGVGEVLFGVGDRGVDPLERRVENGHNPLLLRQLYRIADMKLVLQLCPRELGLSTRTLTTSGDLILDLDQHVAEEIRKELARCWPDDRDVGVDGGRLWRFFSDLGKAA